MLPWENFWEPNTTKQRCVKWGIISLILLFGISIFFLNLDNIQAYEYARKNLIMVEAERKVVYAGGYYYDIYLSYTHDGVKYDDIYYDYSKNSSIMWDGVETLTVAVDPNDPGVPIRNMYNAAPIIFGVVLWALGLSMLIYGIGLEFPAFRQWRVRMANHPGLFSRPYGKPSRQADHPDYLKDWFFTFTPVIIISAILIILIFPYSFGV